jgi:tetratricopeptide (TPR) repeat protein
MNFKTTLMRLIIGLAALFAATSSFSQPGGIGAQMQQAIEQLQSQIQELNAQIETARAEDPDSVPGLEQQRDMLEQQLDMLEQLSSGEVPVPDIGDEDAGISFDGFDLEDGYTEFPELQSEKLASLPDGDIDKVELSAFLNETFNELKSKLPPEKIKEALAAIAMCEDPEICALQGVQAYYEGAPSAAVLLLTYAASKAPTDHILNNCAAILNQCGLQDRAIPCLQYVLVHEPNNTTVLNNMGQAYAGLGDLNGSMRYLGAAMRLNPTHPEACATAAYIEAQRGNIEQAVEYMERATQEGYTERRVRFLDEHSDPNRIPRWTSNGLDLRNPYIMRNDIMWPPQTRSWANCADDHEKQEAFDKQMDDLFQKCQSIVAASAGVTLTGPTSWLSDAVSHKMTVIGADWEYQRAADFEVLMAKLRDITERGQQRQMATDARFEPLHRSCRGADCDVVSYNHCRQRVADHDQYSNELADAAEEYRLTNFPKDLDYYNKIIWLMAIRSTDDSYLKVEQATQTALIVAANFKSMILSKCDPIGAPDCEKLNPANPVNQAALNIKDAS